MKPNELLKFEDPDCPSLPDVKRFFNYDQIFAPVFFDSKARQQCVLVHIQPDTLTATLYYKPTIVFDNSKISLDMH